MNRGIYTLTTGLLHNQRKMDAISNNLANVNTTGYKKDRVVGESFPEVLLSRLHDRPDYEDQKAFDGIDVNREGDYYTLSTDVGYFKVNTPAGIGYSREVKFKVDEDGYLKTFYKDDTDLKTDGENYIMGSEGIVRVEDTNIEVTNEGHIMSNGQDMGNLLTFPPAHIIGTMGGGVRTDKVFVDFSQGDIINTGNNMDFAIKGDGFFKVSNQGEVLYTRDGSFTLNDFGELVTKEGYIVMGQDGPIQLQNQEFTLDESGQVIQDNQVVDKLDIVELDNSEYLRKQGNNLYKCLDGVDPVETSFDGEVLIGYLETSNVNTVKAMVDMISAMRNYESNQRMIRTQDELLGKAVSEIGRV